MRSVDKNALAVRYWVMKKGMPFRSFLTKADRTLYLKKHKIKVGPGRHHSLKEIVKFTMAE